MTRTSFAVMNRERYYKNKKVEEAYFFLLINPNLSMDSLSDLVTPLQPDEMEELTVLFSERHFENFIIYCESCERTFLVSKKNTNVNKCPECGGKQRFFVRYQEFDIKKNILSRDQVINRRERELPYIDNYTDYVVRSR
jgi:predicted RNA-binding Zn-ribbon protein involved in translation (DUF1610 family)